MKILHNLRLHHPLTGVTLLELLISIALLALIVYGVGSINLFSNYHIISSDRRMKLQNELSFCLEHMSKNISRGVGTFTQPPLEQLGTTGFRVRIDPNGTPADLTDDLWVEYSLAASTSKLSCHYAAAGVHPPTIPGDEILSDNHLMQGVVYGVMPDDPGNSPSGMYINLTDNYTVVEVGLIARQDPSPSQNESLNNPQAQMKMRLYAHGSAAN